MESNFLESVSNITRNYPPKALSAKGGLYYGLLSVTYLFYNLTRIYGPEFRLNDEKTIQQHFESYLDQCRISQTLQSSTVTAGCCGVINPMMAFLALEAAALGQKSSEEAFIRLASAALADESELLAVEWLYGLAGLLYLSRLIGTTQPSEELERIQNTIIDRLIDTKRPFTWHGKAYVGAAHGVAGILCQIILTRPGLAPQLEEDIEKLLKAQFRSGNFPSSLPAGYDRLVQFCHGAPGVITSLLSIRPHVSSKLQTKIDLAVERGRACVEERGVLTKEPCLCHGTAGNVLALEKSSLPGKRFLELTKEGAVRRAVHHGQVKMSDHPESLWCGVGGRAWLWAVVERDRPYTFLGFNDI